MPIVNSRTWAHFTRVVRVSVRDEDDIRGGGHPPTMFAPRMVIIEFERRTERDPWALQMVSVSGPMRKKDTTLGAREDDRAWTALDDSMPQWLRQLTSDEVERAEQDRAGAPAPAAPAGKPHHPRESAAEHRPVTLEQDGGGR